MPGVGTGGRSQGEQRWDPHLWLCLRRGPSRCCWLSPTWYSGEGLVPPPQGPLSDLTTSVPKGEGDPVLERHGETLTLTL